MKRKRKSRRQKVKSRKRYVLCSLNNFAPGATSAWQFGHLGFSCLAPHSLQNFAPACSCAPHLTQGTVCVATSSFAPHSLQNLPAPTLAAPHFGHLTVAAPAPPPPCGCCCGWVMAFAICPTIWLPMAKPAPSPAP